ncbi:MAG: hypothetical protein JXB30_03530 [Anaerolineae bacterium]|nr:hypothetical protein [Anaerolineae bacterium]
MIDRIKSLQSWLVGSDTGIALLLFWLVSSVCFATITGVTSSNDGSHYALVRAIVERGSFEISPYLSFTENQDYAFDGERCFSDRPPGTALLAAPVYALSYVSPLPAHRLPSKHDPENPRLVYAVATAALAAGGVIALFFLTLRRHFELSATAAVLSSLALAFGTTMWKYGSVLYSHAQAALVIWLALYLLLELEKRETPAWPQMLALGLTLGFAPLIEYTNVLVTGVMVGYLALLPARRFFRTTTSPEKRCSWIVGLSALAIGAALPLGFLLIYNILNFGGPLQLSTFHVDTTLWPHNTSVITEFGTSPLVGIPAMLFYDGNNQGLFLLSPIALLGIVGLPAMFRYEKRRAILLMTLFTLLLIVMASNATYNPLTNDSRYITPFVGLWFVPVGFFIDRYYTGKSTENLPSIMLSLLLYGLLFLSMRNQLIHIAFSWNYDFSLESLRPMATPLDNITLLFGTVFRNAANLPLLWLFEGCGILISIIYSVFRHKTQPTKNTTLSTQKRT